MPWCFSPPRENQRVTLLVLCALGFGAAAGREGSCVDSVARCQHARSELLLIQQAAHWQRANLTTRRFSDNERSKDGHRLLEGRRMMLQATTRLSATHTDSTPVEKQQKQKQPQLQLHEQQWSQSTHDVRKTPAASRQGHEAVANAHNTVKGGSFTVRLTGEAPRLVFIPDEPIMEREFAGAPVWAWLALITNFAAGPVASMFAKLQVILPQEQRKDGLHQQLQQPGTFKQRIAYLDTWRFICLVILTMSDKNPTFEAYVRNNVLAVQHWDFPLLVFVSGTCFSLASMNSMEFVAQLLRCFSLGTFINWLALICTRAPWWLGDSACGVTFSMRCILGLTCCMVAGAPLKQMLKTIDQSGVSIGPYPLMILLVLNTASIMLFQRGELMTQTEAQFLRVLAQASVSLLITTFGLNFLPKSSHDLLGWVLFAWMFVTRIAHPEPQLGLWFHLVEVFFFAMVVQHRPMRGQAAVGTFFVKWWPLGLVLIGTLLQPGLNLRQDLNPSQEIEGRARFYVVEGLMVLAFATVPSADQDMLPVAGRMKATAFLASRWASFAFITNYAIRTAAPTSLCGSLLLAASAVPFAAMTIRIH